MLKTLAALALIPAALFAGWHADVVINPALNAAHSIVDSASGYFAAYDPEAATMECFERMGFLALQDATCSEHAKAWRAINPDAPKLVLQRLAAK